MPQMQQFIYPACQIRPEIGARTWLDLAPEDRVRELLIIEDMRRLSGILSADGFCRSVAKVANGLVESQQLSAISRDAGCVEGPSEYRQRVDGVTADAVNEHLRSPDARHDAVVSVAECRLNLTLASRKAWREAVSRSYERELQRLLGIGGCRLVAEPKPFLPVFPISDSIQALAAFNSAMYRALADGVEIGGSKFLPDSVVTSLALDRDRFVSSIFPDGHLGLRALVGCVAHGRTRVTAARSSDRGAQPLTGERELLVRRTGLIHAALKSALLDDYCIRFGGIKPATKLPAVPVIG